MSNLYIRYLSIYHKKKSPGEIVGMYRAWMSQETHKETVNHLQSGAETTLRCLTCSTPRRKYGPVSSVNIWELFCPYFCWDADTVEVPRELISICLQREDNSEVQQKATCHKIVERKTGMPSQDIYYCTKNTVRYNFTHPETNKHHFNMRIWRFLPCQSSPNALWLNMKLNVHCQFPVHVSSYIVYLYVFSVKPYRGRLSYCVQIL